MGVLAGIVAMGGVSFIFAEDITDVVIASLELVPFYVFGSTLLFTAGGISGHWLQTRLSSESTFEL